MRSVSLRPRAQLDLESIYTYIALDLGSIQAADAPIEAIYDAIEQVAELPELGRVFGSDDLEHEHRRILRKNYWIYYTHDAHTLTVWRVFHTLQDVPTSTLIQM